MRILNLLAWVVLLGLAVLAVLIANRLGFPGLLLLGVLTWLICSQAALNQDAPTWGAHVFRARMLRGKGHGDAEDAGLPFRFYARCGMAVAAIGGAGSAWQYWRDSGP